MGCLLSIVVPTKNRYDYLKYFIANLQRINSSDFELVIQDNSDDNSEFSKYVESLQIDWIKYYYNASNLSISENSDLAILNSSGEYVCYMGDDDGVTSDIVDWVHWMKTNSVDTIKSSIITYYWPDTKPGRHFNNAGRLQYRRYKGRTRFYDPQVELVNVLKSGCLNLGLIPLVYHGIVKRKCLDVCYDQCGTYFPAPCPDIANGVAMSLIVKKYAIIDKPIFISGASKHHGGKVAIKDRYLRLQDMFWMSEEEKNSWDSRVPKFGLGECIYANSALIALKNMHHSELEEKLIFEKNYACTICAYPELKNEVLQLSKKKSRVLYYSLLNLVDKLMQKAKSVMTIVFGISINYINTGFFQTINDAILYIEKDAKNRM